MVEKDLLDNMNEVFFKNWRKTDEPFGGIQVLAGSVIYSVICVKRSGEEGILILLPINLVLMPMSSSRTGINVGC